MAVASPPGQRRLAPDALVDRCPAADIAPTMASGAYASGSPHREGGSIMPSPTHAIPTHPYTREHASLLLKKALLVRGLAWCQRLYHGLRSPLISRQQTPSPCLNDRWMQPANRSGRSQPGTPWSCMHVTQGPRCVSCSTAYDRRRLVSSSHLPPVDAGRGLEATAVRRQAVGRKENPMDPRQASPTEIGRAHV
jgi:hypothetical protein